MSIIRTDIFTFRYFAYGEAFHGSYRGMRYMIGRDPLEMVVFKSKEEQENAVIRACVWPEPFSYDKTPEENKEYKEFEYSEAGVSSAIDWLNETWEKEYGGS